MMFEEGSFLAMKKEAWLRFVRNMNFQQIPQGITIVPRQIKREFSLEYDLVRVKGRGNFFPVPKEHTAVELKVRVDGKIESFEWVFPNDCFITLSEDEEAEAKALWAAFEL